MNDRLLDISGSQYAAPDRGTSDVRAEARHEVALLRLADQVVHKLAVRMHPEARSGTTRAVPTDDLVHCLLAGDEQAACDLVLQAHRGDGSLRNAYFRSLAPALCQLGEMWDSDEVSFVQVSLSAGWILSIMRALRRDMWVRLPTPRPGHLALFANDPGEGHVIGVTMAADLFREQGWQVDMCTWAVTDQLVELARRSAYPVVALSAGRPIEPERLSGLIIALRRATPDVRVLISGRVVDLMPGIGPLVGADAAETDFDRALACCEAFVTGR